MAEKKKETRKENVTADNGNNAKLSYEDLEKVAYQLRASNTDLYKRLQNAENVIAEFNEIGMLLDILAKSEHFSEEFITRCSKKIEEIVTKALDNAEKAEDKSGSN